MIYPRQELEEFVIYLADKYPKCFVVDPRMRRPLKRDIVADLQKAKVLDGDRVTAAVNFYTQNWTYQKLAIQAGLERVDLDGRKAGAVTEQEQRSAQKKVQEEKQELSHRHNEGLPTVVINKLSKGVAPMKKPELPKDDAIPVAPKPDATAERMDALVASLHDISTRDKELKATLVIATANLIVVEAQKLLALAKGAGHD